MRYSISTTKKIIHHPKLDVLGFVTSMVCAIHCAAIPFLLSLAPLAGFHLLAHPMVEFSVIAFGLLVGSLSLTHGYRYHRRKTPLYTITAGFVMIFGGHLLHAGEAQETFVTVVGAILVAVAHLINQQYMHKAKKNFSRHIPQNRKQVAA